MRIRRPSHICLIISVILFIWGLVGYFTYEYYKPIFNGLYSTNKIISTSFLTEDNIVRQIRAKNVSMQEAYMK